MVFGWVVLAGRWVNAEPRISTTANRAVAIAPWPVWLLGLAAFAFLVYPYEITFASFSAPISSHDRPNWSRMSSVS